MLSLRSAAKMMDPTSQVISVRQLAKTVLLQPPISLRHLIELGSTWIKLKFVMQQQQQGNWCWAAVAVSVCKFFNPNCSWTQCSLVNAEFGRSDCCTNGSNSGCNRGWYLDSALKRTGNFQSWENGAHSEAILPEVSAGRPLCAGIGWIGGGGHFVAITGICPPLEIISVSDPGFGGTSDVVLSTFLTSYLGSGTWTDTYWVHP